ncbi:MAG: RNA 2',3'-cyclic phosphodiesterase [Magnetococcales bacterium]|nr:RNA 2',3'-cyclic phosphodiesterase [Magnetococcales bacterium]
MSAQIRYFIAISPPEHFRKKFEALCREGTRGFPELRWSEVENLHMTLRFLGAGSTDPLAAARYGLDEAGKQSPPFSLRLGDWGGFPRLSRARVLWLGVEQEGVDCLVAFAARMAYIPGWPPADHPFVPHVTMARSRTGVVLDRIRLSRLPLVHEEWMVDCVHLMASIPTAHGVRYLVEHTSRLSGQGVAPNGIAESLVAFKLAFANGERNFVLEDSGDGVEEPFWIRWSEQQGWVRWQILSTCDHQCRLGTLTPAGQTVLQLDAAGSMG